MKVNDKFFSAKYINYREWIWDRRNEGFDWNLIKFGLRNDEEGLLEFLSQQRVNMSWDIDLNEWLELVEFEKEIEELEL